MRPSLMAYQDALREAQHNLAKAERQAEQAYNAALRNAKSDAERTEARRAKQQAVRKAQDEARQARRVAQEAKQQAEQSCRNPKQPETSNNNPVKNNPTEGTLGHGPRGGNPSVRMDLRVVDGTGKPVSGVKTKLWSERQSNGFLCETFHTTDALGKVLMDPIHFTKTLQLKLEAKGFAPQTIQVDPAQLDQPFTAVLQVK
jgi:flagellar biosynthesis GTPase FlhF